MRICKENRVSFRWFLLLLGLLVLLYYFKMAFVDRDVCRHRPVGENQHPGDCKKKKKEL